MTTRLTVEQTEELILYFLRFSDPEHINKLTVLITNWKSQAAEIERLEKNYKETTELAYSQARYFDTETNKLKDKIKELEAKVEELMRQNQPDEEWHKLKNDTIAKIAEENRAALIKISELRKLVERKDEALKQISETADYEGFRPRASIAQAALDLKEEGRG